MINKLINAIASSCFFIVAGCTHEAIYADGHAQDLRLEDRGRSNLREIGIDVLLRLRPQKAFEGSGWEFALTFRRSPLLPPIRLESIELGTENLKRFVEKDRLLAGTTGHETWRIAILHADPDGRGSDQAGNGLPFGGLLEGVQVADNFGVLERVVVPYWFGSKLCVVATKNGEIVERTVPFDVMESVELR